MKTVLALIVLAAFSFSLAFKDNYLEELWEDQSDIAWDGTASVVLQNKVYQCSDVTGCGCPMLLCTGNKTCERHDETPSSAS
ncbi:hypothetical protein OS493_023149 [Desmophyllum pertusum]|uniref:Uncharacterized protein n=1 Tax=Desmophyllum pertusum TaxID=174260 RepID=A0A9W9YYA3_9CNID|nr:hypothetical protein OS493_023149 [Desmophyllum pertusum]